uniref:tRNA selenocysteine-associated protein 1 n=1 Tax=Arion vulgaris TaxID=1028688 RepID=A0A0B7BR73_9EUPU
MFNTALSTSLWMGDLDDDLDEQAIVSAFAQLGEVVINVKLMKDAKNCGSLSPGNYCFVEFPDVDSAQRVLQRLNGKYIPGKPGKRFKLNPASFGRDHELLPEFSLYVGELSWNIDDYDLYAFFQKRYKSVRGAKVVLDQNGKSKGFGFVRFSEENDQQRALIEMQHMTGLGRRPIKVSLASIKRPNDMTSMVTPPAGPPASHNSYYSGHYSWGGYNYHYTQSSPDYGKVLKFQHHQQLQKMIRRFWKTLDWRLMWERKTENLSSQVSHFLQHWKGQDGSLWIT